MKAFLHSSTIYNKGTCSVVVCEKDTETNETKLRYINEPKRSFWVTKKKYRTHSEKKEYETMNKLDRYIVPQSQLTRKIFEVLKGYRPKGYVDYRELYKSPYLYGADISIDTLIKRMYYKKCSIIPDLNVGSLDIEQSVLGDQQINVITYVDGKTHNVYTGILKRFLKDKTEQNVINEIKKSESYIDELVDEAKKIVLEKPYKYNLFIHENELEIIKWVFSKLHECKPEFCTVWNIGYDIPTIMNRLDFYCVPYTDVFCHPEVPDFYRHFKYREDKSPLLQHFTDKWDFVECSGYTQFIDAMCLYSRLRKVDGREMSYALDYIAKKILGTGKLKYDNSTHYVMQTEKFVQYVAYNIVDTVLTNLLEKLNRDISNMLGLLGINPISVFAKQTVMLKNIFYDYCVENKAVPASVAGNQTTEYDDLLEKLGGGVLSPLLAKDTGVQILQGSDIYTKLHKFVCDLDVSSEINTDLIAVML